MERVFPLHAAHHAAGGGHGLHVSLYLAHLLTARLVQPIEQMTAHLNNVAAWRATPSWNRLWI